MNPSRYLQQYRGQNHGLDEATYNQALVKKCLEHGVRVVGIADHGSVEGLDALRAALTSAGVVVFPGFEIASTEKIHMVCLFAEDTTRDQLNRYLGKLDLTDVEDGVRPSSHGCLELATRIEKLHGFWYAAHITGNNGLLRLNKDGGGLQHIWTNARCVRVAQIPDVASALPDNYRTIVENKNLEYYRDRPITVINAKDVAKPEDLDDPHSSSWIKMTRPSFEAFKIAFLDPESRVRLRLDEAAHSVISELRVHGGYLDGLEARFSDHLNAVIGGRGTGKSTLLECLRYALELSPKGKQAQRLHQDIIKENLGKQAGTIELKVRSAARHGNAFTISRRFGEPPIVRDASGAVSSQAPRDLLPQLEVYGQNEIFELAQDGPSRARLLERFLPADRTLDESREVLRKRLAENADKTAKARNDLDELSALVDRLPKLGEQLKGFQAMGIEAKLEKTPLLARERQLIERANEELAGMQAAVAALGPAGPDLAFLSDKAVEGLPNAARLVAIRSQLEKLGVMLAEHHTQLEEAIEATTQALAPHVDAWRAAIAATERELEVALGNLPNMAGKSGREVGAAYRQLTQEIERIRPQAAKTETLRQLVATLEQERTSLIAALSDLRRDRASALQSAVKSLNARLKGKLQVELFAESDRSRLLAFLTECRLEGVGEKRLAWLDEASVTPLALARSIRLGASKLSQDYGLTPLVADALAKLPHSKVLALEAVELDDKVRIKLNVAHGSAELYRDLDHLSTGQQCTAVLHLLLLDNLDPLIVDQPEDNLDNAFIAERIVRELRDAKTQRQFLFSTHNANIPVFGDAEWIGVLTASENQGRLEPHNQGSIDVANIREQAAEILEGGRVAFMQRKEMYEF